jgi:two-component system, LytTR family, response regulator
VIRAIIVDDETLARRGISRLLKGHDDITVVSECADGTSAVAAIIAHAPDLVFLDVQMPEMTGFDVVAAVGEEHMPATIFVTAHDRYAIDAFEANAVDYLLKPFGRERFDKAVSRARSRLAGQSNGTAGQLVQLLKQVRAQPAYADRVPVALNDRVVFVRAQDIDWIEADGNYARLYAGARVFEIRETLTALERSLDPRRFLRIHRSTIVNADRIIEVRPWFHGHHIVVLANGKELRLSRYQRESVERLLGHARSSRGRP